MDRRRDLLEKQILRDAKDGDTTVLALIISGMSNNYVYNSLDDRSRESLSSQQLEGGEEIED